jgi:ATP-binding cassette, subfamily F, member 3
VIALEAVSKAYGGQSVLDRCSWRIGRGERIGLVGPNGAGKTTLCRILAGIEEPDGGRVQRDSGVRVGYLPQEVSGADELTVLAEALSGFDEVWRLEAALEDLAARMAGRDADAALIERYGDVQHRFEALGGYHLESQAKVILAGLGFKPDELHRPLGLFSGGWRMRAALARLLLLRPDVLLLDEPTNHLDLATKEMLLDALHAFDGSMLFVSHDRAFLRGLANRVLELGGESGVEAEPHAYPGTYVEYVARSGHEAPGVHA